MTDKKLEKVYVSRDETDSNFIYIWFKPIKGNWSPTKLKDCETVNWQREDMSRVDVYTARQFKLKFGITIRAKTKKCIHLPTKLLNTEDYKLFSNDPDRKK